LDSTKPVVWKEGTFVSPQHFQQQYRHYQHILETYVREFSVTGSRYGFTELEINKELLKIGKFSVSSAQGFFPDGHFFQLNNELVIQVPNNTVKSKVYLTLPLALEGSQHFGEPGQTITRNLCEHINVFDSASSQKEAIDIEVAHDNLHLQLDTTGQSSTSSDNEQHLSGITAIAIAEILETTESGEVILNQSFIPSALNVQVSTFLQEKNKMLHSLMWYRAEQIIERIQAGQGDKSDQSLMKNHMWLQTLNRWLPWIDQLVQTVAYPTPLLYQELTRLLAELSSLIPELPQTTSPFYFDQLHSLFNPLYLKLKQLLGTVVQDTVVTFAWDRQLFEKRRLLRTLIKQPDQMADRRFVLAAQSSVIPAQLASILPASATLAGSGRIVERVRNAMSGIDIKSLAVPPEQLKPLQGYQYFDINVRHELWQEMLAKGETLNMHVDNRVPDLKVVMYAI